MKKKLVLGLTNQIKIAENNFIKKSSRASDSYLNRLNEQNFYKQAQDWDFVKIPQKIVRIWTGQWLSKMPYFPTATTLPKTPLTTQQMVIVLNLINKLHQQNASLTIFNPETFLNFFTDKVGVLEPLQVLEDRIDKIIHHYYLDDYDLVPSHNDLIRENFLNVDHKIYLIDFEYVSLNHPFFDYASFITESLSFEEAKQFEAMLNLNAKELKKLHQIELYQDYLWAHWAEYLYRKTKNRAYQKIKQQKVKNALIRAQEN